ncbi:MAG: hypothetical protein KIT31_31725 [Deltaproteobacteria bacterium]|nr:hypothetical protein [Deltaproteobacteria bacterium]
MRTLCLASLAALAPSLALADEIEFAPVSVRPYGPEPQPADTKAPPKATAAVEKDGADAPIGATSVVAKAPPRLRGRKWIEPYGAIAGGMHLQSLNLPPEVQTGTQNPTIAVSRLGVRGGVGDYITFASEFEASLGGPLGYGASVWEGQAAIAIRDQYLRYTRDGFSIAAGRIADPASFDYVSAHVGDLLYTDLYTRDPLLYAGADRGNGLFASYELGKHVTVAGTFHSTNPTGITGTLVIGGKLTPFDRPFYLAAAQVGNSQNNLPDQNLHIYFGSPSVLFHSEHLEAKAEVQMYSLDTQQAIMDDQAIRGYNLRLGVRAHLPTALGRVSPFANVSRNKNEILDPVDSKYRLPDLFTSYTVTTGVDLTRANRSGAGVQYSLVDTREPDHHTREHYLSAGASYWIEGAVAIGVRASVFAQQLSGEMVTTGSRSLFVTARLVLD